MIALRRADVAKLNAAARALMDGEGKLGRERLRVRGREFAAGDRVVCRRNAEALGVRNGTRGTVAAVHPSERTLTLATDRGERVDLPHTYLEAGHVEHAYALTGHACQGLTVERAFVLGSDRGRLQEWGYVALSRARATTRLYITSEVGEPESHFHELDEREPLTRLAQALEQPGAERLASEQRALPAGPRPGSRPVIARAERPERARLRLLEKRERETELLRARAERRLAEAEERVAALGWRAGGRRGRDLRGEIALQRSALSLAEEKLARLARERTQLVERFALGEERAPTRPRERRPERERQLNLDLGR